MSTELRAVLAPEDVWQEALLHAWRARERFEWRGLKSFRRWILEIAERCIGDAVDRANALKRGGVARTLALRGTASEGSGASRFECALPPLDSTTPSRIAIHREQSLTMSDALASLPEDLREVVRLRLFDELSCDEVAERLAIGVAVVKYRFRKGGTLYREHLNHLLTSRSVLPPSRVD
ncbi:MAG: sigma-70 family RNA polymerase sigma factor [Planctomycetota bacterium]